MMVPAFPQDRHRLDGPVVPVSDPLDEEPIEYQMTGINQVQVNLGIVRRLARL